MFPWPRDRRAGILAALIDPTGEGIVFVARNASVYVCESCGGEALKWQGQCPHCSAWNSLKAFSAARAPASAVAAAGAVVAALTADTTA